MKVLQPLLNLQHSFIKWRTFKIKAPLPLKKKGNDDQVGTIAIKKNGKKGCVLFSYDGFYAQVESIHMCLRGGG